MTKIEMGKRVVVTTDKFCRYNGQVGEITGICTGGRVVIVSLDREPGNDWRIELALYPDEVEVAA